MQSFLCEVGTRSVVPCQFSFLYFTDKTGSFLFAVLSELSGCWGEVGGRRCPDSQAQPDLTPSGASPSAIGSASASAGWQLDARSD